jgi:DNA repair exonuclease SbcCD nuclease subunit
MIKIAHIADLHIGSNQYGILQRRINQRKTILKLAEEIKGHDVCLVAGDIFDSPSPTPDDISLWCEFGKIVSNSGCKIIASVGNHDKLHNSSIQWVELNPFIHERIKTSTSDSFYQINLMGLSITLLDHIKRRDLEATIESIPTSDIVIMHQSCAGFMSSIMRPELDEELLKKLSVKAKYIALGDLHIHKIMKLNKQCVAAYPGNIDFLRLCDPHKDFKFLSIEAGDNAINGIKSIPFTPTQTTEVISFCKELKIQEYIKKNPQNFYITRYLPQDYELLSQEIEKLTAEFPDLCLYLYREKPRIKAAESKETIQEDTDFMGLVKKESYLEDRDVDIINDIWNNPNNDNVESILRKDLESQVNANNQSIT